LEGARLFIPDSFDFMIQTVGVFTNEDIIIKACQILIQKLKDLVTLIESNNLHVVPSENTMQNSFDIVLEDEDYTIGKVLEYLLYTKYYQGETTLTFCGFTKMHPHDTHSIIRVAYKDSVSVPVILQNLLVVAGDAIAIYERIRQMF